MYISKQVLQTPLVKGEFFQTVGYELYQLDEKIDNEQARRIIEHLANESVKLLDYEVIADYDNEILIGDKNWAYQKISYRIFKKKEDMRFTQGLDKPPYFEGKLTENGEFV